MANRIVSLIVELTAPGEVRNSAGRKLRPSADELPLYLRETVELRLTVQSGGVAQDLSAYTSFELVGRDPADLDSAASLVRSTDHTTAAGWTNLALGRVGMTLNCNTVELGDWLTTESGEIAMAFSAWSAGAFGQFLSANWRALAVRTASVVGDGSPVYAGGLRHNLTATSDPTAGDDTGDGYATGSAWVRASTGGVWLAVTVALGAAVWHNLTAVALRALALLAPAADKLPYFTSATAAALCDLTASARTLLALSVAGAGQRLRASGAGVWALVSPTSALANLTGAATPALIDGQTMTGSVTGIVSGITPSGLADGEGCVVKVSNASLYAITIAPMVEAWPGSTADRAVANSWWTIWRSGSTYYLACKSLA